MCINFIKFVKHSANLETKNILKQDYPCRQRLENGEWKLASTQKKKGAYGNSIIVIYNKR